MEISVWMSAGSPIKKQMPNKDPGLSCILKKFHYSSMYRIAVMKKSFEKEGGTPGEGDERMDEMETV